MRQGRIKLLQMGGLTLTPDSLWLRRTDGYRRD